jgi:hypothetical protein
VAGYFLASFDLFFDADADAEEEAACDDETFNVESFKSLICPERTI